MAEVLAVVASGAGVASIALQLVDTATRLRALWADIKDAPLEVIELVREIELLGRLLGVVKATNTPAVDNAMFQAVFDQCYTWCEESTQSMEEVAKELETLIKQRNPLGAVRVVLKKDKIAKLRSHLERAKSSLLLAQQTYLSMQNVLLHKKTEIILTTQERLLCQPSQTVYSHPSTGCNQRASIQDSFEHADSKSDSTTPADRDILERRRQPRYHKRQKHHLAFRTPAWLTGRVWDIHVREACSGWTLGLSTYNMRPDDAPVFDYTMDGDLHSLQRLFDRGEASPFDRDPGGQTLLHIAVEWSQPEVCRFLIDQGVDSKAQDFEAMTALGRLMTIGHGDPSRHDKVLDLYRLLITQADTDELIDSESVLGLLAGFNLCFILPDGMRILLNAICFPWTSITLEDRVNLVPAVNFDSEVFKLVLGPGPLRKEAFECARCTSLGYSLFSRYSLFSHIAMEIGYCCCYKQDDAAWQLILQEAIGLRAYLGISKQRCSPLEAFLNALGLDHTKIGWSAQPYHYWLQSLQRAGADLVEYGQEERKALKSGNNRSGVYTWGKLWDHSGQRSSEPIGHAKIIDLTFGPEPEDWHIWFSWPLDEWAGEFWHMVENPELFDIPGAWPAVSEEWED